LSNKTKVVVDSSKNIGQYVRRIATHVRSDKHGTNDITKN
jgi:hypothetical protein